MLLINKKATKVAEFKLINTLYEIYSLNGKNYVCDRDVVLYEYQNATPSEIIKEMEDLHLLYSVAGF